MYPIVANAILRGHNLIQKKTIEDFIPRIEALARAVDPATDKIGIEVDWMTGKPVIPTVKVGGQVIGIIPVIGPLSKYGDMCSYGVQDYQRFMGIANADPSIDGILLLMDGPGGTVDGTPEFGLSVKNNPKPVGVFGDNMVASAHMWVASQAAVIVGNKNNPTEFGSIGVLMVSQDWNNVMDAGRLPKMQIIRAPQSTEKALINGIEPLTADLLTGIKDDLRGVADAFISTVKAGRGDKLNIKADGLFNGRMFDVNTAKQIGLIDAVGTFQTALNKVAELARKKGKISVAAESTSTSGPKGQVAINPMSKLSKLTALLGAAATLMFTGSGPESKEVTLTAEQSAALEASEKKLTDAEAESATIRADSEAQKSRIAELEKSVAEHKAQITALTESETKLKAENASLQEQVKAKPTGVLTTVIPDGNKESKAIADPTAAADKNQYRTSIDVEVAQLQEQKAKLTTFK
jgi:protease-4